MGAGSATGHADLLPAGCQPAGFGHGSGEVSPSRPAIRGMVAGGPSRPPIGRLPRAHGGIPMARRLDSTQVVRPTHFGHAVLRTRNLDEAIAWWETVVGMRVVHRNAFIAFLTYDDEHHRLALVQTGEQTPAPPGAAGLDHLGYTVGSLGELLGTYRRLEAKGILPVWSINHGLTSSLYYASPDGIRVEFQVENFETKADLEGFMRSDAFAKNPIGVEFDPAALAARYERGDPLPELLRQGATP